MYTQEQSENIKQLTGQLLSIRRSNLFELKEKEAAELSGQLKTAINYYDWQYYVQSAQVIPDVDYDFLFDLLKTLEQQFPALQTPDSPDRKSVV